MTSVAASIFALCVASLAGLVPARDNCPDALSCFACSSFQASASLAQGFVSTLVVDDKIPAKCPQEKRHTQRPRKSLSINKLARHQTCALLFSEMPEEPSLYFNRVLRNKEFKYPRYGNQNL